MEKTRAVSPLNQRGLVRVQNTLGLKVLVALTTVVLLAHLAVLRGAPMALGLNMGLVQPQPSRAFTTRSIELARSGQTLAARPVAPPAASRRQSAAPALARTARTARPEPADSPSPSAEEAAPPPAVMTEAENPSPSQATPAQDEPPSDADQPGSTPRLPRDPAVLVRAYTLPGSVRFNYKVEASKFPYSGSAELLWQRSGASYDARLELSTFGQTRVQSSRGQITPEGLAPIRFSDKYRSEVAAHFDREKGKVTFSANTPDAPLLAGAQDRLSILVQLAAMIAGDPGHYPPATTITIQTIGPRAADTWLFTVGSAETLTLPGGQQVTLKLVRNPRQEFDQKVELWLAPALGYLPVRIRITEPNGDFIDQKWLATEALI